MSQGKSAMEDLLEIMAKLRSPEGCPWDREQDHKSLKFHAVEEVYELMDSIEAEDDVEMLEELGDLLLQVVFHCQLAKERGVFDFEDAARRISEKLIRRHPHVFENTVVDSVDAVWTQWEQIKKAEKAGTPHERQSVFDGIPKHLPALLSAEKTIKKAVKSGMMEPMAPNHDSPTSDAMGLQLFKLVQLAYSRGWSAEDLLRQETRKQELNWRKKESNHE
ncbi:MAG TPA: MazG family protein [Verrucomicrobiales bacterium]|nr:MazG family protein [Verrucomicrobiales bacterium]HIL71050.1 MazG family protein [Verrucomicrobiota bacterium]